MDATSSTPQDDTDTLVVFWAGGPRPGRRFPDAKRCSDIRLGAGSSDRYAVRLTRRNGLRVAGDVRRRRRGGPEAPRGQPNRGTQRRMTICRDEFGLAPSCTRPAAGCRSHPRPTNIFLHGVSRVRPLLSARRRVPMLPVRLRADILACRARHPGPSTSTSPSSAPSASPGVSTSPNSVRSQV